MNEGRDIPTDAWLLDDHLGQLSDADRQRLHEALGRDPQLAARHRRLQRILQPLDAYGTPPPPPTLISGILDRIAAGEPQPTVLPESFLPGGATGGLAPPLGIAMRDILAVAAVITFFFALLVPSMAKVRERSQRVTCASHLGTIGRGVNSYALANAGTLPASRIRFTPYRASFLPVTDRSTPTGAEYSPNTRSLLLLVKMRFVRNARVLICPSQKRPLPLNDIETPGTGNLPHTLLCSYDSINMAGPTPTYTATSALPYAADANPLFDGLKFNRVDPTVTNSPNHRKASGQNVLRLDGSVNWCTTPNCGLRGDNIWQAGKLTVYNGTEVQQSKDDTFLVP